MNESPLQHMKIESRKIAPDVYELAIEGYLDFSNAERLEAAVDKVFGEKIYKIVFDLSQTKYISSAGFGCFISSIDIAVKNGGNVVFAGTPPPIKEIFDILGLSKILRFGREREDALKILQTR